MIPVPAGLSSSQMSPKPCEAERLSSVRPALIAVPQSPWTY